MSPNPWNARTLVGLAAVAVVIGLAAAHCENHDQAPAADPCSPAAYALPAALHGTKSSTRKTGPAPPHASKTPQPTPTHHGHRPHIDIDLELDGC
ncbi:hypothetical protein GCM10010250_21400 [Streptomyces althioticus]|uniref:hypothetical protein n=1 Tax=Streptomyces althioticus TaxID=83380 RepID=UPI0018755301|nr:hypothetical protein GCM10010250_21400 [Streptomyces althioticus]